MPVLPKVLLTGATGFLGSHLLDSLIRKGYEVILLKRSTSNIYRIQDQINKVSFYNVDTQSLDLAFREHAIDVVIHTAGVYGRNDCGIEEVVESNVLFGVRLLSFCQAYGVGVFINADTLLHPHVSPYALSKRHFSDWIKQYPGRLQIVNLKLEHMYGERDDSNKFAPWILTQLKDNVPEISLTSGEQRRDFIYISDVVSAFLILLEKKIFLPKISEFEVGTGSSIPVRNFVEKIFNSYKKYNPGLETELLFGSIPYRPAEQMKIDVNNASLINMGWIPKIGLDDGIEMIVREFL